MPYAECVASTLFSRIINRELPGTFVYRDDLCVGFMTISPITTGHTLVVPIKEVDQWTDLTADLNSHLFGVAKIIGDATKRAFNCERIALVIAGYEIPHCHLHVIPSNSMADLEFANARTNVPREELEEAARRIIVELRSAGVAGAV
jgi:diadenosine tetraphosphate (Ap4A) HIT family hydrolase